MCPPARKCDTLLTGVQSYKILFIVQNDSDILTRQGAPKLYLARLPVIIVCKISKKVLPL